MNELNLLFLCTDIEILLFKLLSVDLELDTLKYHELICSLIATFFVPEHPLSSIELLYEHYRHRLQLLSPKKLVSLFQHKTLFIGKACSFHESDCE